LLQSLVRGKALHKEEDQEVFQKADYSKESIPGQTFSGNELFAPERVLYDHRETGFSKLEDPHRPAVRETIDISTKLF
jgi:hypothetical protein